MAATQMNMRIDSALKATGDLAIREGGSTPSEIVRAVWDYAARNRHRPQAVRNLLDFLDGTKGAENASTTDGVTDEIEEQVLRGPKLIEGYYLQLGINPASLQPTSYESLKSAAFDEDYLEPMPS